MFLQKKCDILIIKKKILEAFTFYSQSWNELYAINWLLAFHQTKGISNSSIVLLPEPLIYSEQKIIAPHSQSVEGEIMSQWKIILPIFMRARGQKPLSWHNMINYNGLHPICVVKQIIIWLNDSWRVWGGRCVCLCNRLF